MPSRVGVPGLFRWTLLVTLALSSAARAQDGIDDLLERLRKDNAATDARMAEAEVAERERRVKTGERGPWTMTGDGRILAAGTPSTLR